MDGANDFKGNKEEAIKNKVCIPRIYFYLKLATENGKL